jgi:HEAT repeat protein
MRRRSGIVVLVIAAAVQLAAARQQTAAPVTPGELASAIDKLGSFDFGTRTEAARTVRRASPEAAVPALVRATREHADEYVRYRALVLLSGFGDAPAAARMAEVIPDKNDRLRAVAYGWFERHPDAAVLPTLIDALPRELSEFVRPALTRAIAAQGGDARARAALLPLVTRGEDFFRGAVIDALGDYKGTYALDAIIDVAKLDGPLQDDAITAIGRIGDASMLSLLATLQKSAPPNVRPTIAAAVCLLGDNCVGQEDYLKKALAFAAGGEENQSLLRGVSHALGVLALRGRPGALATLLDASNATREAVRAPLALSVGMVAVRDPAAILAALEKRVDRDAVIELLRDAFDMLSEDFEEEQFYIAVRREFWAAPAGSPRRQVTEALINKLEF